MVHVTKGKGIDHFLDRIGLLAFISALCQENFKTLLFSTKTKMGFRIDTENSGFLSIVEDFSGEECLVFR